MKEEEEEGMDIIKIISKDNLTIILHKVFMIKELD